MDPIKQAYEDELIMSGMIRYEDFENALKDGKEKCLERLKIDHERHSLDHIHSSISWWACFNKKAKPSSLPNHFSDRKVPTYVKPLNISQNKEAKARKKSVNWQKHLKRKIAVNYQMELFMDNDVKQEKCETCNDNHRIPFLFICSFKVYNISFSGIYSVMTIEQAEFSDEL